MSCRRLPAAPHRVAAIALAAACLLAAPTPTFAVDKGKALATMTAEAGKAYEEGQYARASELFYTAWQMAPAQTGLLYNAARTAQIAGQLERAETLYRKFLTLPERDAKAEAKCQEHLGEIADSRADNLAENARRAAAEGDHARAAQLYREAAGLSPRRARYAALADDQQALAEGRPIGKRVEQPPKPTATQLPKNEPQPTPKAAPPMVEAPGGVDASGPGLLGGTLLGVGAVAGGVAVWLWLDAGTQASALEKDLGGKDADGFIDGVTWTEANDRNATIASRRTGAALAAGASVAALGAGAWLWWRRGDEPRVSLLPTHRGALLRVAF